MNAVQAVGWQVECPMHFRMPNNLALLTNFAARTILLDVFGAVWPIIALLYELLRNFGR